jgi:hypothetical protein
LTTAKQSDAAQVEPHEKAGQQPGGINAASLELGIERTDAQRAVKIAGIKDEAVQAVIDAGATDHASNAMATSATNADTSTTTPTMRNCSVRVMGLSLSPGGDITTPSKVRRCASTLPPLMSSAQSSPAPTGP